MGGIRVISLAPRLENIHMFSSYHFNSLNEDRSVHGRTFIVMILSMLLHRLLAHNISLLALHCIPGYSYAH